MPERPDSAPPGAPGAAATQVADARPSRRDALHLLVLGGGVAFACALAVPAAYVVTAPLTGGGPKGAGTWVKTVPLDALTEGVPKKVAIIADKKDAWTMSKNVDLGAAWLVREGDAVVAFSVVCPHLGCSIERAEGEGFVCPCHSSSFDESGTRLDGPSPRNMDRLATKIEDGFVIVDLVRFKTGTPERIELG